MAGWGIQYFQLMGAFPPKILLVQYLLLIILIMEATFFFNFCG